LAWKVKYIDYPSQYQKLRVEILRLIDETLTSGDVMMRGQLSDFEARLSEFVGTDNSIGVGNCTEALQLCLQAVGVGPDDEVITVSHTLVATVAAIHHNAATPILVDIGEDHNIDPECVEAAITSRTKAIIPVHLNGRVCDMGRLTEVATRHNVIIIEDAAQSLGASIDGKRAGSFGVAGCFSFYPAKILGGYGDGGAVVTNNKVIADKIRLLRNHGRTSDGDVAFWSFNSRLDNLQAAILSMKLKHLPEWIDRRREIAQIYHIRLSDMENCLLPPPPKMDGSYFDVFQNYEIEVENRDSLRAYLNECGIETLIPWGGKGVHQFEALGLSHFCLPRTDRLFERALMLPMHCELTDAQVIYVTDCIRQFYASKNLPDASRVCP